MRGCEVLGGFRLLEMEQYAQLNPLDPLNTCREDYKERNVNTVPQDLREPANPVYEQMENELCIATSPTRASCTKLRPWRLLVVFVVGNIQVIHGRTAVRLRISEMELTFSVTLDTRHHLIPPSLRYTRHVCFHRGQARLSAHQLVAISSALPQTFRRSTSRSHPQVRCLHPLSSLVHHVTPRCNRPSLPR